MGIRITFNLLFAAIWLLGIAIFAIASTPFIDRLAKDEVMQLSRIMMIESSGARSYTSSEIEPILRQNMRPFHPQAVSSYAAKRTFATVHNTFPDYAYREAALNPTNLEDRAADWEADMINAFRQNADKTEIITQRDTPTGTILYMAHPLVAKPACLECHSTPDKAPKSMIALYGTQNGFGWKANDVIGAQIISVPMAAARGRANRVRALFIVPFTLVFAVLCVALNVLLHLLILKPTEKMTQQAEAVSLGDLEAPEYVKPGKDQIARLSQAFNRMRRSLHEAMRLLDDK
jgi:methyl-accepting chemotaxis protein